MTLFELAHHPDAYKACDFADDTDSDALWWGNFANSTSEQFSFLSFDTLADGIYLDSKLVEENVFRMYLLMVHWATLDSGDAA